MMGKPMPSAIENTLLPSSTERYMNDFVI